MTKELVKRLLTDVMKQAAENPPSTLPILIPVSPEVHIRMRPVELKILPPPDKSTGGIYLSLKDLSPEESMEAIVIMVTHDEKLLKPGMRVRVNPYGGRKSQLLWGDPDLTFVMCETIIKRREDVLSYYPNEDYLGEAGKKD